MSFSPAAFFSQYFFTHASAKNKLDYGIHVQRGRIENRKPRQVILAKQQKDLGTPQDDPLRSSRSQLRKDVQELCLRLRPQLTPHQLVEDDPVDLNRILGTGAITSTPNLSLKRAASSTDCMTGCVPSNATRVSPARQMAAPVGSAI
jgi:hypothetical protein